MKLVRNILWSLFFALSLAVHADTGPGLKLQYESNTQCTSVSIILFTNSSHPGGNRNGRLNENNDGYGIRCYLDTERHFYATKGTVINNSQRGDTFFIGPGMRYRMPSLYMFSLDLGFELPYVKYQIPRKNYKVVSGPLPIFYYRPNVALPYGLGEVGLNTYRLGTSGVRLRSIEYSKTW